MPRPVKRHGSQSPAGPSPKRRSTKTIAAQEVDHVVDLLPHSSLKDLVRSLAKDPATSSAITNYLSMRECGAAEATYQSILADLEDACSQITDEGFEHGIWGHGYEDLLPDFQPKIDLLCKAGVHGLELAWHALLKIADNVYYNGEQGYKYRDGPDRDEDDDFHWDMDEQMFQCCVELEAQAPQQLKARDKIRELKSLKRKVTNRDPELAYRYYFTSNYLKWILGGKAGNYEDPAEYHAEPEVYAPHKSKDAVLGLRSKQTARKSAPSSRYLRAFRDRDDIKAEDDGSIEDKSDYDAPQTLRRYRTKQTARKFVTSTKVHTGTGYCGKNGEESREEESNNDEEEEDNDKEEGTEGSFDDDNDDDDNTPQTGRKSALSTKFFDDLNGRNAVPRTIIRTKQTAQ